MEQHISLKKPAKEEYRVPNLFDFDGYTIFFWSNENNEPIHVHVTKGNPHGNSTKIWLTKGGECCVARNKGKIPEKDLRNILKMIKNHYFYIVSRWKEYYGAEDVKFYC